MVVNKLLDQERSKEGAQRKRFMLQGNLSINQNRNTTAPNVCLAENMQKLHT